MSQFSTTSTMTTTPNCCTISNNLILPTQPATSAQTGWNGAIVAINTLGISNAETSTDDSQALSLTALNLLSFSEEGSTAKNMSGTSTNSLPQNEMGTLLLPVNSTTESTGRASGSPYSLLLAQENNYFPVATANGVITNNESTAIALPMPAPCDSSSAANAYLFLQSIMAYPCSPLAQQFTAALSADINVNPATGSCTNVNAFFAQTKSYQNVDFAIYSAVSSYVTEYAYAWANFQPFFTYTVYTLTTTGSSSGGSTSGSRVTLNPLGTIVFSQSANERPAVTDASGGYSMTWNPNEGSAVILNFAAGQLLSNEGEDTGEICLQTAFLDAAALTGDLNDANQASQALLGLINGSHVLGIPSRIDSQASEAPQIRQASQASEEPDKEISSKASDDTEMSILDIVVLASAIAAIVALLSWIAYKCYQGLNPAAEEIAEEEANLRNGIEDELGRAGLNENDNPLLGSDGSPYNSGPTTDITGDGTLSEIQNQEEIDESAVSASEQGALEYKELNQQLNEEEDQSSISNNPIIGSEVDQTNQDLASLKKVNFRSSSAPQALDEIQGSISSNQATIENENKSLGESSPQLNNYNDEIMQEENEEEFIADEQQDSEDSVFDISSNSNDSSTDTIL